MKVGIFSDIHGNIFGFEACLHVLINIYKADRLIFLGDSVGYFTAYNDVINILRKRRILSLLGNHDAMLLGLSEIDKDKDIVYNIKRNRKTITAVNIKYLSGLMPFYEEGVNNKKILYCHGSPFNPLSGYIYPNDALDNFKQLPYDIVFMGHTHYPMIKTYFGKRIVNVGSAGLPRDRGNVLSCVLWDTQSMKIEIIRIPMDVEKIIKYFKNNIHEKVRMCLRKTGKKK